jgi:hypothetical protein
MKSKLALAVGIGIGYVLGTRAGRERFEEIRSKAKDLWESEDVQTAVHTAQEKVTSVAKEQGSRLADVAKEQGARITGGGRDGSDGPAEGGVAAPDPQGRDDFRI